MNNQQFTPAMAEKIGNELGISPANIWAVVNTESSGVFSWGNGQIPILLERHKVYQCAKKEHGYSKARSFYKKEPNVCNPKSGGYGRSGDQYKRLAKAIYLVGSECAHSGTSFGAFQIMGFNFALCGFESATDFAKAMHSGGAEAQIRAFLIFLKNYKGGRALEALKKNDFHRFAYLYNGINYKRNNYASKMLIASIDYQEMNGVLV